MTSPSNDDPVAARPEVFGPYVVHERLGIGGMATVHRAKKRGIEGFERSGALKRLLPHLAEDADFVKSFVREAKLASHLQHANIVQLYELGRVGPIYFIWMEYVEGYDVRKILHQMRRIAGPPPPEVVISVIVELCDALEYAHTRKDDQGQPLGLVHRDVSPSNLIVAHSGHLKVIDFGIAKATSKALKTETGRVKGKLGYMSPEAVQGKGLDARSDIFSAGVIAHELLTAAPLFSAKNDYQTLWKVQHAEADPPSAVNTMCPPELDDVILQSLAKDPGDRFQSAGEMRKALEDITVQYRLRASSSEAKEWLSWAFTLPDKPMEQPTVRKRPTVQRMSAPTAAQGAPAPPEERLTRQEQDEVIEVAWGGVEPIAPVELDDVPDMADKFAPSVSSSIEPLPTPGPLRAPSGQTAVQRPPQVSFGAAADDVAPAGGPGLAASTPSPTTPRTLVGVQPSSPTLAAMPATWAEGTDRPRIRQPIPPPLDPEIDADNTGETVNMANPLLEEELQQRSQVATVTSRGSSSSMQPPLALPLTAPPVMPMERPIQLATARATTASPVSSMALSGSAAHAAASGGATIGAAIVTRGHTKRNVAILAVAAAVGIAAVAYITLSGSGDTSVSEPPPPAMGTMSFEITPNDAVIEIDGKEVSHSSPFQIDVVAKSYDVVVKKEGYRAWNGEFTLAEHDRRSWVIKLEKGTGTTARAEIRSTPDGLDVSLDGAPIDQKTPATVDVLPGVHTIILSDAKGERWRHEFTADVDTNYAFHPVLKEEEDKHVAERDNNDDRQAAALARRERTPPRPDHVAARGDEEPGDTKPATPPAAEPAAIAAVTPPAPALVPAAPMPAIAPPIHEPAVAPPAPAPTPIAPTPAPTPASPPAGAAEISRAATPPPAAAVPAPTRPAAVPTPPKPVKPAIVPPMAVTRVSGTLPKVRSKIMRQGTQATLSAKLCIDTSGRVISVTMLKSVADVDEEVKSALKGWHYKPYLLNGVPTPACFGVTFSLKAE